MDNILNANQYRQAFAPNPSKAAALKCKADAISMTAGPGSTQLDLEKEKVARSSANAIADFDIHYASMPGEVSAATANDNGNHPVSHNLLYVLGQECPPAPAEAPPRRNKTGPLLSPTGNDYNPYGNELKIGVVACYDGILCIGHMKSINLDGFNNYIRQEIRNPNSTVLGANLQICELRDHSSGKNM
jgi:hypothetical protein